MLAFHFNFFFKQGFLFKHTLKNNAKIILEKLDERLLNVPKAVWKHSFRITFSDNCYPEHLYLCERHHAPINVVVLVRKLGGGGGGGCRGGFRNSEGGGQDPCQLYFTENSLKIIENITEKRVAMDPLDPTPKSTHWIYSIKLGPNNFSVHFHSFVGARATSCNISGCYWLY